MVAWHPNKALAKLIKQWKGLHPTSTVYTIADNKHDPTSDHAKDKDGTVDAGDFMASGDVNAVDLDNFAETLRANRDPRIKYVIRRQRIFAGNDGPDPWKWREYSGEYHGHTHVSTREANEDDGSDWQLTRREYKMTIQLNGYGLPKLSQGDDDSVIAGYNYVTRAQLLLRYLGKDIEVDGDYGPATVAAVKSLPTSGDGKTIDLDEWAMLYGFRKVS